MRAVIHGSGAARRQHISQRTSRKPLVVLKQTRLGKFGARASDSLGQVELSSVESSRVKSSQVKQEIEQKN